MPQAKKELFIPAEKLKKVVQLFKDNPNYELTLITDKATMDVQIEMDKEQFTIVFNNLIKNAIQSISPSQNGEISVVTKIKNDWFLVEISDNGIGISAENQSKIFTPNFTTKTSGMGIGLSIVKTIMDNAEGKVSFVSEQGKGTQFYLGFPVK
ncbi:MAG: HAMP domain-containing histidine kinase [Bacteroidales bacterium]|nr:HAMP domain-containing histidine kinase [Bacteroidales bacterium]